MAWRVPRRQQGTRAPSRHVVYSSAPPLRRRKWPCAEPGSRVRTQLSRPQYQRPWPPQALTFKLKMRKPREHLDGNLYRNRSTEGLVAIARREGRLLGPRNSRTREKRHQRRLALSIFPVHSLRLRDTLRVRSCVSASGSCKSAVSPAHSLRLRPKLRLRFCISAFASRKSAVSKPSVNCS